MNAFQTYLPSVTLKMALGSRYRHRWKYTPEIPERHIIYITTGIITRSYSLIKASNVRTGYHRGYGLHEQVIMARNDCNTNIMHDIIKDV
jgi:hypothetical protein